MPNLQRGRPWPNDPPLNTPLTGFKPYSDCNQNKALILRFALWCKILLDAFLSGSIFRINTMVKAVQKDNLIKIYKSFVGNPLPMIFEKKN